MSNPHKGRQGLDRLRHAWGYSMQGLVTATRHESAFRQELMLAAPMLPLAWWLGQDWLQIALLTGTVILVLVVELLNSAIEAAIDRISYDLHPLAKRAKDYGSAAVLLSLLWCAGVWIAALVQRFWPAA